MLTVLQHSESSSPIVFPASVLLLLMLTLGFASLPPGYAAHITLSCADGVSAATAKADVTLAAICHVNLEKHEKFKKGITFYRNKGLAVVKLSPDLFIEAVFAEHS
jgi:hypothetical protein